ncbi:alkaline phosphatase [Thalassolituus sp.]|uniref:alkaline phosphatase D family protein n=1 Tax=Thalassolituus sp. TaxID=2030822 RepID=UPI003514C8D6
MPLSRREFLIDSLASGVFLRGRASPRHEQTYPFHHGVASGDPLQDRVIIWSRITPAATDEYVSYRWVMSRDAGLTDIVAEGYGLAGPESDYTVKQDVTGLQAGKRYFYAFEALGQWSDTGRTRTLPEGDVSQLRLAYTSCSNYAQGYFNVYREIAHRDDLDLVLHLGDYIYEYASLEASLTTGRVHCPAGETVTLDDYRARHACYKADNDLQAVHRQHPFVVIWDDHEVANNAWRGGAANHSDLTQDDWSSRLAAAVQAYYQWMPVREPEGLDRYSLYRGYRFGNLLDLSVLDTRLAGRDAPAETLEERNREDRTLLGYEQESWLESRLLSAQQEGVRWKLLGQQVMMGQLGTNDQPFNYDQWDGYPAARQRLFEVVRRHGIDNWAVLTGDIHSSWAMTLHDDPFADLEQPLGVEFVTAAVTSPGIPVKATAQLAGSSLQALLPHLNFVDFYYRGFVILDITHEHLQAEWWVVNRVDSPRYQCDCLKALKVPSGSVKLLPSTPVVPEVNEGVHTQFSEDLAYLRHWAPASRGVSDTMVAASVPVN